MLTLTIEQIEKMSQEELIENLEQAVTLLKARQNNGRGGPSRADQVLDILRDGPASLNEIADTLTAEDGYPMSTANVSSVLTGLSKRGFIIHTNHLRQKVLVEEPK